MKWLAVLNPHSGWGSRQRLRRLAARLEHSLHAACAMTQWANHAVQIVREHPDVDGFIAVGGDGTISECVNGLAGDPRPLGIVPNGTSNGLAHDLKISRKSAFDVLRQAHFQDADVIDVTIRQGDVQTRRVMVSTSALGFVAGATAAAYACPRRLHVVSHLFGAVWQSFRQRPFPVRLRIDHGIWLDRELTTAAVHNTKFIGVFQLFPNARIDDGRLDLLTGSLSPLQQFTENIGVFTRTFLFNHCRRQQVRHVEIRLLRPMTLMVDGDLYDDVDAVEYEIGPGRLKLCTPTIVAPEAVTANGERVPARR